MYIILLITMYDHMCLEEKTECVFRQYYNITRKAFYLELGSSTQIPIGTFSTYSLFY